MPRSGAARTTILIAGAIAYAAFLAVFAYAAGFVMNLVVPRSIDTGAAGDPWRAALIDVALLGLFAVQHTIMARPAFKQWLTRRFPASAERSLFVLAAASCLVLLYWQWRAIPAVLWSVESDAVRMAMQAVSLLGFGIVVVASFQIDHFHLFGVKQSFAGGRGAPPAEPQFRVVGFYRWVRHPLMTGFLIAFWCAPTMTVGHLLFAAVVTGYILLGTRIEERDLVRTFGDSYRRYREAVPALIPRSITGADIPAARS